MSSPKYNEQSAVWNGAVGSAWTLERDLINQAFEPMADRLVEAVWEIGPKHVLDVGCGTGATTLTLAEVGGKAIRCVGIDISEPMIAAARSLAAELENAPQFLCGNAQTYNFEPAAIDMIISRFGVMFFDDTEKAFRNLRHACGGTARMRLLTFRSARENPFMTTAERAAAPLLASVPRRTDGPGQFAFADPSYVQPMLEKSGWTDVGFEPIDFSCKFPADKLEAFFTRLGPLGRILHEVDTTTQARVIAAVRAAFEPYISADEVRFIGACWMISARAA